MRRQLGFTIVELLVIIVVIAILVGITAVNYGGWQRRTANSITRSEVDRATASLNQYKNFSNNYPPNLAGTNYVSSSHVALVLLTNAPSVGKYQDLTPDQNAQLFLNVCNANLSLTPYNTSCAFQGSGVGAKVHVAGTQSTNTIWNSPIQQSDVTIPCGSDQAACDAATSAMIAQLTAQGGTFPITVNGSEVALPPPTQIPNGPADAFCLQATSADFGDVIYHTTSESSKAVPGPCPDDPSLHYYQ